MGLFEDVFNKASIYEMLFFNVKTVLNHPTINGLKSSSSALYDHWCYISESKYNDPTISQAIYERHAPYHPEYCKIVAITYATVFAEKGVLKRHFKKISNVEESVVIEQFFDILHQLSSDGVKSEPKYFPMLTGYNIINFDIPVLLKRFLLHRNRFDSDKRIPLILKRSLNAKPWESVVVDVANVWKFNGYDNSSLMIIADTVGLKRTVDVLPLHEVSKYYWDNISDKPNETLEFISLQSATQTNLVIQLINELRQL